MHRRFPCAHMLSNPLRLCTQALVEKAEEWLERAADAAKGRAPLKKLRELLHAGVRLGADVPQARTC